MALVHEPRVLFLDEPTTGLDPLSRRAIWDEVRALNRDGTTVFLTTQYLEEADLLADRVAILDGGRIVETGTPAQLKAGVGSDTLVLLGPDGKPVEEFPTDGTVADLRRALDAIDERDASATVALRRPTLDDVFLALTDRQAEKADRIPQEIS
jgi:ABC-2 type transport system ATP-binding protein